MSRLENHAMLRDAATDVFNLRHALLEKYGVLNVGPNHYFGANVKYFELFAIVG